MATSKRLFKLNNKIRDYDIIGEKLQKYPSDPSYKKMSDLLKRREIKLASSKKVALTLRDSKRPHIEENDILSNKLDARFNKVVARMVESTDLNLPIVLTNPDKIKELHELRKYYKQLRYLLELIPHGNDKEVK